MQDKQGQSTKAHEGGSRIQTPEVYGPPKPLAKVNGHATELSQLRAPSTVEKTQPELPRDLIHDALDDLTDRAEYKHLVRDITYPTPTLRFGDQLRVVSKLSDTERRKLNASIVESCLGCSRWSRSQRFTVYQYFREVPSDEKIEILRKLLSHFHDEGRPGKNAVELTAIILGGARDFKVLDMLVKKVGTYNLLETKDRRLRDFAAYVAIRTKVGRVRLPAPLKKGATRNTTLQKLDELEACLYKRLAVCKEESDFAGSLVRDRMQKSLSWTLEYVQHMREAKNRTTDRIDLLNVVVKKVKLEADYNIKVTVALDSEGEYATHWTPRDMNDLLDVHKKLDEVAVTFLPKNAQIRKVPELEGAYAQRDGTGILKIAEYASIDPDTRLDYQKKSPLRIITIHELGHSFHFGPFGDRIDDKDSIKEVAKNSNPLVPFGDFLRLSDWRILPQERYRVSDNTRAVTIDKKRTYQIGQPARLDGEDVVFRYDKDRKLLCYYNAHAQFPLHDYSRDLPWEDFAESFVEYHYLVKRLIEHAPWKALFFEQLFGLYSKNQSVQEALTKQLDEQFGRSKSGKVVQDESQSAPDKK